MSNPKPDHVALDYAGAPENDGLLTNLSTVVTIDNFLWTASDEGRTVECLKRDGNQYRFHRQVELDDLFPEFPGSWKDEADIESIDIADGHLWICSSHARVRRQAKRDGEVDPGFFLRPSQCLFGSVELSNHGGALAKSGQTLPFIGDGSLRSLLAADDYLAPFVALPSKENGLDIEGMVIVDGRAFFGLRGPLVGGCAVVVEVAVAAGLCLNNRAYHLHFLGTGGLGVRDLAHLNDRLLVLAGPTGRELGPYRIYEWAPKRTVKVQLLENPILADWIDGTQAPEGLCFVTREGKSGILIVYDSHDSGRAKGSVYTADWFQLPL